MAPPSENQIKKDCSAVKPKLGSLSWRHGTHRGYISVTTTVTRHLVITTPVTPNTGVNAVKYGKKISRFSPGTAIEEASDVE